MDPRLKRSRVESNMRDINLYNLNVGGNLVQQVAEDCDLAIK